MKSNSVLSELVNALVAKANCQTSRNSEWETKWEKRIEQLLDLLPSGIGFDNGTKLNEEKTCPRSKVVFNTGYHHMNEGGYYCGWTDHRVTVKPDLLHGFTVSISGRNVNDIKDYMGGSVHGNAIRRCPFRPLGKGRGSGQCCHSLRVKFHKHSLCSE